MTETPSEIAHRRPDKAAVSIGIGLGVIAAVIAWNTSSLVGGGYSRIGPAAFPYAISAALAVLAVWTVIAGLRGQFPEREHDKPGPILWIVGGLVAQILLLSTAGFAIATGVLFAFTAKGFGRGPLWQTIPIGIVFAFVVWFIFSRGLQLSLPMGPLEKLIP